MRPVRRTVHGTQGYSLAIDDVDAPVRVFVAASGNDADACSLQQPCQSIERGIARVKNGGTVVVVEGGSYAPIVVGKPSTLEVLGMVAAGIAVTGGDAVVVRAGGGSVLIDGLTINIPGGGAPPPGSRGIVFESADLLALRRDGAGVRRRRAACAGHAGLADGRPVAVAWQRQRLPLRRPGRLRARLVGAHRRLGPGAQRHGHRGRRASEPNCATRGSSATTAALPPAAVCCRSRDLRPSCSGAACSGTTRPRHRRARDAVQPGADQRAPHRRPRRRHGALPDRRLDRAPLGQHDFGERHRHLGVRQPGARHQRRNVLATMR